MKKIFWGMVIIWVSMLVGCSNKGVMGEKIPQMSEVSENSETVEESEVDSEIIRNTESTGKQENIVETETSIENKVGIWLDVEVPDIELNLLQKVLLNQIPLNDGRKISDFERLMEDENQRWLYFMVVDFDHDGVNEVWLYHPPGQVLVFHEENGIVSVFEVGHNGLCDVNKDGTFEGSGATANYSILCGNVSFENGEYDSEIITAREWLNHLDTIVYYKYIYPECIRVEITKEEYDVTMLNYPQEKADSYKLTVENILQYVK